MARMDDLAEKVTASLGGTVVTPTQPTPASPTEKLTDGLYRVRRSWEDRKSQIGAYKILANAMKRADANPGFSVFDPDGNAVYPASTIAEDEEKPDEQTHTVVKGDTLWGIAKQYLGSGFRYTEIVKLNGLKTSVIYSGQKLKIPQK